jgi:membrane fusion protein (multidrug efflux system)
MEEKEKKPKRKIMPFVLGGIILIGLFFGIKKYIFSLHHEVTDDAQIEGDISPVLSRITGYIEKINFEENQRVKKGDTLITIDERDLLIKVDQAKAALDNAIAAVSLAEANVLTAMAGQKAAEASVESARIKSNKAIKDFERYANLKKDTAVSEQQFDNARADKENLQAMLNGATSELASAAASVVAAQKQVIAAKAVVASKQADLDFAELQLSF